MRKNTWEQKTFRATTKKPKNLGINIRKTVQDLSGEGIKMLPSNKKHLNNVLGHENKHREIVCFPSDDSEFNKSLDRNQAFVVSV